MPLCTEHRQKISLCSTGRIESLHKRREQRLTEQLKGSCYLLQDAFKDRIRYIVAVQIDDQKVRQNIFQTQSVFALTGWIAENDAREC